MGPLPISGGKLPDPTAQQVLVYPQLLRYLVLEPTWYFDVVEDGTAELPRVRIVITGRTLEFRSLIW